ncbi:MAG: UDP-N-acetylglucosamine 1-carboxyvinyltransferase [Clostridiales bacterium]|jgi:UDP-N-acetylglucosamine 1-carboxyvinyltransferase|nr:UDP-N-acetylglucosamine 1-carboxyvinyltransferase [Clostridiales bacterium]
MGKYIIRGGRRISGTITVDGAKNAVLPILAAIPLCDGKFVVRNCPDISDTHITIEILKSLCYEINFDKKTLTAVRTKDSTGCVPDTLVDKMRSSIIFMGSLLASGGFVEIGYPGGCELGKRPIDIHLAAFRKMGAKITEREKTVICEAKKLKGCDITLDFPSVGATENIMLAAVRAEGTTTIKNAAREPEIRDLAEFLNKMGANVSGAGESEIKICGVKKLCGAEHTVLSDRIVAGTFLAAAAMTGGEITLQNVIPSDLNPICASLAQSGCIIKGDANSVTLHAPERLSAIDIITEPHPGFPTDMQAQMCAMLSVADGFSVIDERIFSARNKHIPELIKMGADIKMWGNGTVSTIRGVDSLHGAEVSARDLRGGAALIMAAIAAKGESIVKNSEYVERGYSKIEEMFRSLGADIDYQQ